MANLQRDRDARISDEEFSKRQFLTCVNKFSIYLYLTLRNQGLFDNTDKSVEEIAREYQVKMLAKNTLEKQQKRLVCKLLAVEEDATLGDTMDIDETPVIDEQIYTPSLTVEEPKSEPLQTEREIENLRIMQALTKIKLFVNSSMAVSIKTVQDLLAPIVSPSQPLMVFGTSPADSGFDSLNTNTQTSSTSCGKVATRDLGKIMRVSKCNQILSKSVDEVLKGLENVISKNDMSVYENWEGSYFDSAVCLLNQLVEIFCQENEENRVRTKCSEFTQRVIVELITFVGMDTPMQKLKYYFLMQFIGNVYVCYDTINFLFQQLIQFETCSKNREICHKIPIHTIENCFYIFEMLKSLLNYYMHEMKANITTGTIPNTSSKATVMSSDNCFGDAGEESKAKQSIHNWKITLNQLITSFADTFPLHAIFSSELLEILL